MFRLPWSHKSNNNWDIDDKTYGVFIYNNVLYRCWGQKIKSWELPFVSYGNAYRWERYIGKPELYLVSSYEKENWETHPYKMKCQDGCQEPTTWTYDYTDPYDGTVVPCKFWVEEMEWRPKWLKWTKRFSKIERFIEIEFSQEMGSKKNTWKGGTVGCGYNLLSDEHPEECIQRMEKEYKFS